jgi:hypothetical protein
MLSDQIPRKMTGQQQVEICCLSYFPRKGQDNSWNRRPGGWHGQIRFCIAPVSRVHIERIWS